MFALALVVVIAMAGLLVDGGLAMVSKRQAQGWVDTAALAAARALGTPGGTQATAAIAAAQVAGLNGFTGTDCAGNALPGGGIHVQTPYQGNPNPTPSAQKVLVEITRAMRTTFAGAVGQSCWLVSARAVAQYLQTTVTTTTTLGPAVIAQRIACHDNDTLKITGDNVNFNGSVVSNSGVDWNGTNGTVTGTFKWVRHHLEPRPSGSCEDNTFDAPVPATTDSPATYTDYPLPYRDYVRGTAPGQLCAPGPDRVLGVTLFYTDLTGTQIDQEPSYWKSAPGVTPIVLKDGVYCNRDATGVINIHNAGTSGKVTLVAYKITSSATGVHLDPYLASQLTLFADYLPGDAINWSGSDFVWTGIVMAPGGQIHVSAADGAAGCPSVSSCTAVGSIWGSVIEISGKNLTVNEVPSPPGSGTTTSAIEISLIE